MNTMRGMTRESDKRCLLAWVLCLALMLGALTGCGGTAVQAKDAQDGEAVEISETAEADPTEGEDVLPPVSERMTALEDAKNYLEIMALSRDTLIAQLEFDGFSTEEAEAAADNCGADWNEQAVRQAQSYLETMELTYDELVDQLEYDKFTPEQASYGADNCGAEW